MAADVYTAKGHLGRGGWTWYTGSASWMYRVGLEAILGFTKRGDTLEMDPCIPAHWPEFSVTYRCGSSSYAITVRNPHSAQRWCRNDRLLDGRRLEGAIQLTDDGERHEVIVTLGSSEIHLPQMVIAGPLTTRP